MACPLALRGQSSCAAQLGPEEFSSENIKWLLIRKGIFNLKEEKMGTLNINIICVVISGCRVWVSPLAGCALLALLAQNHGVLEWFGLEGP